MKFRLISISCLLCSILTASTNMQTAIFAGGCFWCAESDFEDIPGVSQVISGYTGGSKVNPTYEEVSTQSTGHYESIKVLFDSSLISYRQLVDKFWRTVDPTDSGGQFCDRGPSYRTAIFYLDDSQKNEALASKAAAEVALGQKIVTEILPASTFYPAEDYHQKFSQTHKIKYSYYRFACGRDKRVKEVWSKSK